MWLAGIAMVTGLVVLVWGADRFVTGAAATARNLGVSPLVVGLTVVGFGTSAPEMVVSALASLDDNPGLAIGNAIGSNISNIALILGSAALVSPLDVHSGIVRRELPLLSLVSLGAYGLVLDGRLGLGDGLILATGLVLFLYWTVRTVHRARESDALEGEFAVEVPADMSSSRALTWLAVGLVALLVSSRLVVWGAVTIAEGLGVSDLIIGLSLVAIGTSLPELASSVASAIKGEHDIAIGNVIGSNLFNLLAVLPMPALIRPGPVDPSILSRDFPVMLGLTVLLLPIAFARRGKGRINRGEAALLLGVFAGYLTVLYLAARGA
jgi:cation:H+ antiporter